MKILFGIACLALLAGNLAGFAETETTCGHGWEAPLRARSALTIHSRPAGLEIVGTDKAAIHVTCVSKRPAEAEQIHMRFAEHDENGTLTVRGRSNEGSVEIRIEVPRKTSLRIRMPAGQVKVDEVAGDKDIDVYAGQISISSTHLWDYRRVHASVDIGDLKAQVYGADRGGFFRTFSKQSETGEYSLHAHVMTGQIELLGTHGSPAPE